jgi:hypothetical protein
MQSGYLTGITATLDFGLGRLKTVLEGLTPEQLTQVPAGLKNSIATLILHMCGTEINMAHRVTGKAVPVELKEALNLHLPQNPLPAATGETVASLLVKLDQARMLFKESISQLTDKDLEKEFEFPNGRKATYKYLCTLLPHHQGQHLGHIQYIKMLTA